MADKIGNMYTYKCQHCKGAHLTKQSPESRAARGILTPSQKRKQTRKRAKRRAIMAEAWMSQDDKKRAAQALAKAKPPPQEKEKVDEPDHPVLRTGKGLTD